MQAALAPLDRPAPDAPPVVPAAPVMRYSAEELAARRERSALLRAWETATLTRANFCVLKRITEPALEAQLAVARQEREQDPPRPERGPDRPDRPDARPDPRRDPRHNPGADRARPGRGGPRGGPGGG